jgi:hypothetical protein
MDDSWRQWGYCWQIHLPAGLVLSSSTACSALSEQSIAIILRTSLGFYCMEISKGQWPISFWSSHVQLVPPWTSWRTCSWNWGRNNNILLSLYAQNKYGLKTGAESFVFKIIVLVYHKLRALQSFIQADLAVQFEAPWNVEKPDVKWTSSLSSKPNLKDSRRLRCSQQRLIPKHCYSLFLYQREKPIFMYIFRSNY